MTSASEVLEAAADYMETHGWCQGDLRDPEGRVCAAGAIEAVTTRSGNAVVHYREALVALESAIVALESAIEATMDPHMGSIPMWNDAEDRTVQDVLDGLRKAAKLARIREEST